MSDYKSPYDSYTPGQLWWNIDPTKNIDASNNLDNYESPYNQFRGDEPWYNRKPPVVEANREYGYLLGKLFEESDDPVEVVARLNSSRYLSQFLGESVEQVYQNYDDYAKGFFGKSEPRSNWDVIKESWKVGELSLEIGRLGTRLMQAGGQDANIAARIDELYKQYPSPDSMPRHWTVEALKAAATSLPHMSFSLRRGALWGGAAGLAVAGIAAASGVPMTAGTTAGLTAAGTGGAAAGFITIPAMAYAVLSVGFTLGSIEANREALGGMQYVELRRQGIPHNIAWGLSEVSGVIQAAIETTQSMTFIGKIPGVKHALNSAGRAVAKKVLISGVLGRVAKGVAHYGTTAVEEGVEEVAQQLTQIVTEELAREISGVNIDPKSRDQILQEIGQAFKGGLLASLVLGAPGAVQVMGTSNVQISDAQRRKQTVDWANTIERIEGPEAADSYRAERGVERPERVETVETVGVEEGRRRMEITPEPVEEIRVDSDEDIPVRLTELASKRNEILRRISQNPKEYSKELLKNSEQITALQEMRREVDIKAGNQPWRYTSDEWGKIENIHPERRGDLIFDDWFLNKIADNAPLLSKRQVESTALLLTLRANKRGISRDEYLNRVFHPEIFASEEQTAELLSKDKMGAAEFLADGRALLHATEKFDFPTMAHELGHVFRRELRGIDLRIAEEWAGVTNGEWTREAEEKFTNGFVQWLQEGKAPSPELRNVFQQFAEWLKNIYNAVRGRWDLTPDIRRVFENLFASERETSMESTAEVSGVEGQEVVFRGEVPSVEDLNKKSPDILFKDIPEHEEAVRQAVEQGVPVPDRVLEEYGDREWAADEIRIRAVHYEWAQSYLAEKNFSEGMTPGNAEEDFIRAAMAMDIDDRPRSYYEYIYQNAGIASDRPVISDDQLNIRQMNNQRFVDALTRPHLIRLLRDMAYQNKLKGMHGIIVTGGKAAIKGEISEKHYKKIMDQIRSDPDFYREQFALILDDQEEWEQIQREREMDPQYEELEELRRKNRFLKNDNERKTNTLQGLEDSLYNANARVDYFMRQIREQEEEYRAEIKDLSKSAKGEARKQTSISKKETLAKERARVKELKAKAKERKEAREYFKGKVREIFKPPGAGVDIKFANKIIEVQAGLDPQGPRSWGYKYRNELREQMSLNPGADWDPNVIAEVNRRSVYDLTLQEIENIANEIKMYRDAGVLESTIKGLNEYEFIRTRKLGLMQTTTGGYPPFDRNVGSVEEKKERQTPPLQKIQFLLGRPDRIIEMFDGGEKREYWELLREMVNEASDQEITEVGRRIDAAEHRMKGLGLKPSDFGKIIATKGGVQFTVDDAIHIYIGMQNEDSRKAILYGNRISREDVDYLINLLTPEQIKWAEFLLEDFGEENFDRINEVFRQDKNMEMLRVNSYFPMRRVDASQDFYNAELVDELAARNGLRKAYPFKGFTFQRKSIAEEFQIPIRLGATSLWYDQVVKQEKYIATAVLAKRLHKIFGDTDVQRAIRQRWGETANEWIKKYINDFINPNIYTASEIEHKASRLLRHHAALSYLGFNFLTPLKQLPSVAFYLSYSGPTKLIGSIGQFIFHGQDMRQFVYDRDPQVKYRSFDRITEELKLNLKGGYERFIQKTGRIGMAAIQAFDRAAIVIGWKAVYDRAIADGKTEEEAITAAQDATIRTQPQARAKDLPQAYRTNEILNWFLMFSNQLNQIYNILTFDIPTELKMGKWKQAMGNIAAITISAVVIGSISKGRLPDSGKDIGEDILNQLISAIPVVGGNMKSGMDGWFGTGVDPIPVATELGRFFGLIKNDEIELEKLLQRTLKLIEDGLVFGGLPSVQPRRVMYSVIEGDWRELFGWEKDKE